MGTVGVGVLDVDPKDVLEVAAPDDQEPVQALGAHRPDPALRMGVRVGACTGVSRTSAPSATSESRRAMPSYMSAAAVSGPPSRVGPSPYTESSLSAGSRGLPRSRRTELQLQWGEVFGGQVGDGVLPVGVGGEVVVDELASSRCRRPEWSSSPVVWSSSPRAGCGSARASPNSFRAAVTAAGSPGRCWAEELGRQVVEEVVEGCGDLFCRRPGPAGLAATRPPALDAGRPARFGRQAGRSINRYPDVLVAEVCCEVAPTVGEPDGDPVLTG